MKKSLSLAVVCAVLLALTGCTLLGIGGDEDTKQSNYFAYSGTTYDIDRGEVLYENTGTEGIYSTTLYLFETGVSYETDAILGTGDIGAFWLYHDTTSLKTGTYTYAYSTDTSRTDLSVDIAGFYINYDTDGTAEATYDEVISTDATDAAAVTVTVDESMGVYTITFSVTGALFDGTGGDVVVTGSYTGSITVLQDSTS
jgi:hypothetical protein